MLRYEWDKWWLTLPALEAREALNLYRVLFVSDAGWKLDEREQYVREWQERAEGAQHLRYEDENVPGPAGGPDISHEVRRLFGWLRERWTGTGGGTDQSSGGFTGE